MFSVKLNTCTVMKAFLFERWLVNVGFLWSDVLSFHGGGKTRLKIHRNVSHLSSIVYCFAEYVTNPETHASVSCSLRARHALVAIYCQQYGCRVVVHNVNKVTN